MALKKIFTILVFLILIGLVSAETIEDFEGSESSITLDFTSAGSSTTYFEFTEEEMCVDSAELTLRGETIETTEEGKSDVVLITDVSGSMRWRVQGNGNGDNRGCSSPYLFDDDTSKISLARCLDIRFVDNVLSASNPDKRMGLVSYASTSSIDETLTNSQSNLEAEINSYSAGGATCISCAMDDALDHVTGSQSNPSSEKSIVLMTDGQANRCLGGYCSQSNAKQEARDLACDSTNPNSAVSKGVTVYSVAFGGDADESLLQDIAGCTGGSYYQSQNPSQLQDIYDMISQELTSTSEPTPALDVHDDGSADLNVGSTLNSAIDWDDSSCPGASCDSLVELLNTTSTSCSSPPCRVDLGVDTSTAGTVILEDLNIETSLCRECGDGITQRPNDAGFMEECDDGNNDNNDICRNDCTWGPGCGDVDLVFAIDTSASFNDEWSTMENNIDSIIDAVRNEGFRANTKVYALDPTERGDACYGKMTMTGDYGECTSVQSGCCNSPCGVSGTDYYSCGEYSVIDEYADSINCPECGGTSKAPSEAWGVGARAVINDYSWIPGSYRYLIFIGDEIPTGGTKNNIDASDEAVANDLVQVAKDNDVTIFGLHGDMEYTGSGDYGDPSVNDARELMEHVTSSTGGNLMDYGSDSSQITNLIINTVTNMIFTCGPDNETGVCSYGTNNCGPGTNYLWTGCSGAVNPSPEACNGLDDDCDGLIDESYACCGNGDVNNDTTHLADFGVQLDSPNEECDDGNNVNNDGCSAICEKEYLVSCGDGIINQGWEICDDGNNVNGDGCSANCLLESLGYCGDGSQNQPWEECDDGNNVDGDGCSAGCLNEVSGACGDGSINQPWEECDDGNNVDLDGCSAWCLLESPVVCGDGSINQPWEECDDNNNINGDGCSAGCLNEVSGVCGDGSINQPWEECDDNNNIDGDGCSAGCLNEVSGVCGDGSINQPWEECDDNNNIDGDGCSAGCHVEIAAVCGDGSINLPSEECDDENLIDTDACDNNCKLQCTLQQETTVENNNFYYIDWYDELDYYMDEAPSAITAQSTPSSKITIGYHDYREISAQPKQDWTGHELINFTFESSDNKGLLCYNFTVTEPPEYGYKKYDSRLMIGKSSVLADYFEENLTGMVRQYGPYTIIVKTWEK